MSTGSFGCVIQTALIHASVHPSSRADCPLKVAVGFFQIWSWTCHYPMYGRQVVTLWRDARGAGGGWLWNRVETGESHRRVRLASLYQCCEFG